MIPRALILLLLMAVLAACGSDPTEEPTDMPTATVETVEPTIEAEETVEAEPTEETVETPEPTPEVTPEEVAAATEEPRPNVSPDGQYRLIVVNTVEDFALSDASAPEGERWVLTQVTLGNEGGPEITVEGESITALDADGNRYIAESVEDSPFQTPFGMELLPGEPVRGFVRFTIPAEAQLERVEWCPTATCESPLSVEI